jgi:hypothetical protein
MTPTSVTKVDKLGASASPQPISLTYRPSSYNFVMLTQKCLIFASGVSSSSVCYLNLWSSPFPGLHFASNLRCLLVFLSSLLCRSPAHPTNVQPPYLVQYRARAFPVVPLVPQGAPGSSKESPQGENKEGLLQEIRLLCLRDFPLTTRESFPLTPQSRPVRLIKAGTLTYHLSRLTRRQTI